MLKEEEGSERNGRPPHFCSDGPGYQLFPRAPSDVGSLGPPDTGCHHGEHHSLIPTTFSCQVFEQSLDPQQLNIQFDPALGQQEELHSLPQALPVLFSVHPNSC